MQQVNQVETTGIQTFNARAQGQLTDLRTLLTEFREVTTDRAMIQKIDDFEKYLATFGENDSEIIVTLTTMDRQELADFAGRVLQLQKDWLHHSQLRILERNLGN